MLRSLFAPTVVVFETTEPAEINTLHPAEVACVESAVEKRRGEFAAGRLCARRALAVLGIRDFPLLPDADRVPIWPLGVVGSISHCTGFFGAAVARCETTSGLGVDVELADPLERRLVPKICTPAEETRLACLPRLAGVDWHKLVFSAKESVYKAYYPLSRTFLDFHDVDVVLDPDAGTFAATLVRHGAPTVAGARTFRGRYAFAGAHVFTAVVLPSDLR